MRTVVRGGATMSDAITVRGTIMHDGSLRLEAPLTLPPGEVEVLIRPAAKEPLGVVIERIRARQKARGYVPRSAEEVQEQLRQTDEEWEERDREIDAIHDLNEQPRAPTSET